MIKKYQELVEQAIQQIMADKEPKGLYSPVSYVLGLGGKRIRPVLCLMAYSMFEKEKIESCINPAIGLEVFHNFTLLHDDIMDGSKVRRNNPTVHVKWNNNTAILSGDAMLIIAYHLISQTPSTSLGSVLSIFNKTALEVCEGQQLDMEFEARLNVSESEYIEMIRLKTAVLLGASLQIGAITGGAKKEPSDHLNIFGNNIGISFQLQDDWLDVYGNPETFGKSIGNDIVSNKKTYLLINALNKLTGNSKKELIKWVLAEEFDNEKKIDAVRNLYHEANVSAKTKALMNYYFKEAISQLELVDGNPEIKDELIDFATKLNERVR